MAKNQVPEKVPKYRFAVWNVWYKTVHLKVCKIVECEMLGIVCLRIKIALLEPVSPLQMLNISKLRIKYPKKYPNLLFRVLFCFLTSYFLSRIAYVIPAAQAATIPAKKIQSRKPVLGVFFSSASWLSVRLAVMSVPTFVSVVFWLSSFRVVVVASVLSPLMFIRPVVTDFMPPFFPAFGLCRSARFCSGVLEVCPAGSAVVSVLPSLYSVLVNSITTFVRSFVSVAVITSAKRFSVSRLSVSCVAATFVSDVPFTVFRVELHPDINIGREIHNIIYPIHFIRLWLSFRE